LGTKNINNFNTCLNLVKGFRDEFLHKNIDELANFSFWDIAGHETYDGKYKGPADSNYDGDRINIVYAIDYLLYHDSDLPNGFTLGDGMNYSGDTINTFRTLFGNRFNNDKQNGEEYVESLFHFSESEKKMKNEFFRTYQKFGNFYVLPNGSKAGETLNKYRGIQDDYRDFFDVFLNQLDLCLKGYAADINLDSIVKEPKLNKDFFNKYADIKQFCQQFYLTEYLQLDYKHPKTLNNKKCCWKTFYSLGITEDDYKNFAFGYIAKATELINNRSLRIVEILKTKYPELR